MTVERRPSCSGRARTSRTRACGRHRRKARPPPPHADAAANAARHSVVLSCPPRVLDAYPVSPPTSAAEDRCATGPAPTQPGLFQAQVKLSGQVQYSAGISSPVRGPDDLIMRVGTGPPPLQSPNSGGSAGAMLIHGRRGTDRTSATDCRRRAAIRAGCVRREEEKKEGNRSFETAWSAVGLSGVRGRNLSRRWVSDGGELADAVHVGRVRKDDQKEDNVEDSRSPFERGEAVAERNRLANMAKVGSGPSLSLLAVVRAPVGRDDLPPRQQEPPATEVQVQDCGQGWNSYLNQRRREAGAAEARAEGETPLRPVSDAVFLFVDGGGGGAVAGSSEPAPQQQGRGGTLRVRRAARRRRPTSRRDRSTSSRRRRLTPASARTLGLPDALGHPPPPPLLF
jgi:hypothetical protein